MARRMASRDEVAAEAQKPRKFEVVPDEVDREWLVGHMSMGEKDTWEREVITPDPKTGLPRNGNFRGVLMCLCLCDEAGKRLFDLPDSGWLSALEGMDPVVEAALKLNRLRSKDLEEAEKNSPRTPNSGSGSTSATGEAGPSTSSPSA